MAPPPLLLTVLVFLPLVTPSPIDIEQKVEDGVSTEGIPTSLAELVALLTKESLTPTGQTPQQYASFLLSGGGWANAQVKHVPDNAVASQPDGDQIRKHLAEIILAAREKKKAQSMMDKKELPLIDLFPEADIRIADTTTVPEDDIVTTVVPTTTIAEEETTTVEPTTTTENPANFAKTGSLEVLVADIVSSGHMLHWSSGQQYLAIADMWGQKYIR